MTRTTRPKQALHGMVAMILLALVAFGAGASGATADPARGSVKVYSSRALAAEAAAALAAGHPGRAILAYRRAAIMAPTAAIREGLARAQTAAGLPPAQPTLGESATRLLGANAWAWVGMSGLLLGAAGLAALGWGLLRRRGFIFALVAAASITGVGMLAARQVSPPPGRAVVVASDVVVRIAPFATAEASFAAREGIEATIERSHGGYTLIRTPDGEGWVPHDAVETIVPPDPTPDPHRS